MFIYIYKLYNVKYTHTNKRIGIRSEYIYLSIIYIYIYISCCNEIEYLLKYLYIYIYISLLPKKLCIYSYKILRAIYNNI